MSVLQVGFFGDVLLKDYKDEKANPLPASQVAREITEGSFKNAPARDFMKYTKAKYHERWQNYITAILKQQKGNFNIKKIWEELSPYVVASIHETMREADVFLRVSSKTSKKRAQAGIASDNPFIATGGLYKSVEGRIIDAPSQ